MNHIPSSTIAVTTNDNNKRKEEEVNIIVNIGLPNQRVYKLSWAIFDITRRWGLDSTGVVGLNLPAVLDISHVIMSNRGELAEILFKI
jgi:hypothetical protein